MVRNAHRSKWPNSFKTFPSGVANCCNLPFDGRATRDSRVRFPRKENARSRHQVYLRKTSEKLEKGVVYEL